MREALMVLLLLVSGLLVGLHADGPIFEPQCEVIAQLPVEQPADTASIHLIFLAANRSTAPPGDASGSTSEETSAPRPQVIGVLVVVVQGHSAWIEVSASASERPWRPDLAWSPDAGDRVYDPLLGRFLTVDPAKVRQASIAASR